MIKRAVWAAILMVACLTTESTFASPYYIITQDTATAPKDWFLLDPEQDKVQGLSVEKTYTTLLNGKPSRTVIVAVIDSGIDIDHEDLKDVIWKNEKEIPGNGIDDDKNGYVDDVYGWNFIGGKDGRNVDADTYELTREYTRLKPKYENIDEKKISKKARAEYEYWLKISDKFTKLAQRAKEQYNLYSTIYENMTFGNDTLKKILNVDRLTYDKLESLESKDYMITMAKSAVMMIFQNAGPDADIDEMLEELKEAVNYFEVQAKYGYNPDFDSREIVGDNYKDLYEKGYGNNDVKGPDPSHGTHVAGIIAANRKNDLGIKGIADNVKIMTIRAVPNGDERDKDIANAILYAVDNGAHIINMSFGKDYSPEKEAVDKAVKYAEQKGVLLIHAAGNDADNNDDIEQFPSRYFKDKKEAKNWIEVAASSAGLEENFVASFTNFGKKSVDLFSPGVDIYSTVPDNKYKNNSGTSMASPATAGVAALLMSYFPDLSAAQVRDIIRQSTRKFDGLKVIKPDTQEEVEFNKLSNTGGLINAYEAVRLAMSMQGQKVVK